MSRIGISSRTSHARWTADVRNLTGMPQSSSFLFCFSLVAQVSDKRGAENSQNLHQIVELISRIEGQLQSWSITPLQVASVCAGIFQIFVVCWSKGSIVDKQVDIVKVQLTWTQSGQTDPHAVTVLFLWPSYIHNVTRSEQKLHHSACICPRRLRVWGRSKFTKHGLTLQKKALHFFFWISHCMLAAGALETCCWWPHLANFRLDVLIVVFSGRDSFSRIWLRRERERERERGGGGVRDWTELKAGVNFAFRSQRYACRGETSETWTWVEVQVRLRGEWQSAP